MKQPKSIGKMRALLPGRLHADLLAIATGEGIARICNLTLVIFLSRRFGVRAAGAYAMAQALFLYQMNGTDFGLRQTGARLVARSPARVRQILGFVQRRRILLAMVMAMAGYWYAAAGPVPRDARELVAPYALTILGYGLSVDWLAWGMRRFAILSGWRASVSFLSVAATAFCVMGFQGGLLSVPLATGFAYLAAAAGIWVFWARRVIKNTPDYAEAQPLSDLPDWKSTGGNFARTVRVRRSRRKIRTLLPVDIGTTTYDVDTVAELTS